MTVCLAAICQWNEINPSAGYVPLVIGAADRMLTASDVQYEPPQRKIFGLTKNFVALIAGDAAVHSRIITSVVQQLAPKATVSVLDAAEAYAQELAEYRRQEGERLILRPLGLTFAEFVAHQNDLASQVVDQVVGRLQRLRIEAEAIIAGVDALGPHIYVVRDPGTVTCHDFVGFAAIGIGASHAASQFMFAKYSRDWSLPQTLFLTFSAKKRAEVAPGVGKDTDLFYADKEQHWLLSPEIKPTDILDRLLEVYDKTQNEVRAITKTAETEVVNYVKNLVKKAQQGTAQATDTDHAAGAGGIREGPS